MSLLDQYRWIFSAKFLPEAHTITFTAGAIPRTLTAPDPQDPTHADFESLCLEWQACVDVFRETPVSSDEKPLRVQEHVMGALNTTLTTDPTVLFTDVFLLDSEEDPQRVERALRRFRNAVDPVIDHLNQGHALH